MTSKKQPKKCRNMMYEQQLRYLPGDMNVDAFFHHIETKLHPKRWAGIVHDHDYKADNKTPAEDHLHVMMQFENARSLAQVAKDIGDSSQYVEAWNDNVANGFAYLIHATSSARHKHQYSADQVHANFDYAGEIARIARTTVTRNGSRSSRKIDLLLDEIANGTLTLKEAKATLSGSEYAKAAKNLNRAHGLFLERKAQALKEEMTASNRQIQVHWIEGNTGSGKTRLAKYLASQLGEYFITTTHTDPFQYYQGEPVIILDEFRPNTIKYSELLAMFDPFSFGCVVMSSRYSNKTLAYHTIFVTSPYSPRAFYEATVSSSERDIDSVEQLYRRLTTNIEMYAGCKRLSILEYDEETKMMKSTKTAANPFCSNPQLSSDNNILNMLDWSNVKMPEK